jgi:hypothetical protein
MVSYPADTLDNMLDEITRWRTQAKSWEQLCHQLAECLIKQHEPSEVLLMYRRTVRAKYQRNL